MSERAIQNGYLIVAQQEIDELRRQKAALVDVVERMRAAHRAQLPSEARDQFGGGCGCPLCEAGRAALAAAAKGKP